jgi:hypothetical protein
VNKHNLTAGINAVLPVSGLRQIAAAAKHLDAVSAFLLLKGKENGQRQQKQNYLELLYRKHHVP